MNQILAWAGYAGGFRILAIAHWAGIRAEEPFDAAHVPTSGGIRPILVAVAAIPETTG